MKKDKHHDITDAAYEAASRVAAAEAEADRATRAAKAAKAEADRATRAAKAAHAAYVVAFAAVGKEGETK
tara:strand:- start:1871 stop:2080 length:210 start_codon:yes stop_codon:yes gene_type:complete